MPSFRGTLTLEEAWAMARYLHTFVPGAEESRTGWDTRPRVPEFRLPNPSPMSARPPNLAATPTIPAPVPFTGSPFNR